MKRSPMPPRRTELARTGTPARSGRVSPKRRTPRRRPAPQWDRAGWEAGNILLIDRAGNRCEVCQTDWGPFERHHRKRRRDGGDRLSNLLYLCQKCHQFYTEHPGQARRWGVIVSVYNDPAVIPVLWRRNEWMILGDDGSLMPWPDDTLQTAEDVKPPPQTEGVAGAAWRGR